MNKEKLTSVLKSDKSAMEKWEGIQKLLEKAGNEAGVSFVGHDRQGDSDVHVPASGQKRVAFAPSFVEESVHRASEVLCCWGAVVSRRQVLLSDRSGSN